MMHSRQRAVREEIREVVRYDLFDYRMLIVYGVLALGVYLLAYSITGRVKHEPVDMVDSERVERF